MKTTGLIRLDRQPTFPEPVLLPRPAAGTGKIVRRRITPEAGHGLEILGHALEYLTDEFVRDGCRFAEERGRVEAIQLLASLNRQIYFACEVEPSLGERVQAAVRRWWRLAS